MRYEEFEPFMPQRYRSRLPVSFDNSLDLYEQIVAVIEYFNHVIENSNKVTKEIIALRDEFEQFKLDIENRVMPENLKIVLEEWLKSGKLETVINDALFKGKSTIITSELEPKDVNDTTYWYKTTDKLETSLPTLDGNIGYEEI